MKKILKILDVTHNDTSAMSYVLKDHIGSLYATVTDGEVEYYSFDAWGRERNHNTLQYDNINTAFDRGFCMHEHYRDFNLINMNGRLYDPLVGRMLSPDIVIQDPEYSQSYNRYSYCFNNPLRFTDPSGYVVTIPPEYLKMLEYASDINKYEKEIAEIGIDLESISYNTEELEGSIRTTVSWTINEDNYRLESVKFLYDNYKQKYATSCIASSLCAIERRSNSCDFNEEEIMNIQKDSYKNGLNLDNALQYYVNKSKIFSQYTKHKISDIDNYEKYLFQEMYHMNRPTSLLVQNKNWIFNHFVNTYNVTKLYINDIDNDFDINIWDSANDGTSDIKNINSFDNVLYMILYGEK